MALEHDRSEVQLCSPYGFLDWGRIALLKTPGMCALERDGNTSKFICTQPDPLLHCSGLSCRCSILLSSTLVLCKHFPVVPYPTITFLFLAAPFCQPAYPVQEGEMTIPPLCAPIIVFISFIYRTIKKEKTKACGNLICYFQPGPTPTLCVGRHCLSRRQH